MPVTMRKVPGLKETPQEMLKKKLPNFETIILERNQGISFIVLNRPQVLNAQNALVIDEFSKAVKLVSEDPDTTVVVIKGNGEAFCSGFGINERLPQMSVTQKMQETTRLMLRVGKPTIASIQGYCLGGGVEWALNCDMRIAAADAQFGFPETRVGATITNAGSKLLPLLVGLGRANELILTGQVIGAETAERWGLVNRVVSREQLEAETVKMAQAIQNDSPLAVYLARSSFWYGISAPIEQVLDFEMVHSQVALQAQMLLAANRKMMK
jgi:enoyl-CoA hydratase/carnithine racemase